MTVCLCTLYERKETTMGQQEQEQKDLDSKRLNNIGRTSRDKSQLTNFLKTYVAPIIGPLIVNGGIFLILLPQWISIYENKIDNIAKSVEIVDKNVNEMADDLDSMEEDINSIESELDGLKDRMYQNEADIKILNNSTALILQPTAITIPSISVNYEGLSDIYYLETPQWKNEDVIGIDGETGKKYCAQELVDEKLLFTYKEGRQDVIFYGQFNDKNQWNGGCTLNVYEENKLILIMDAVYEDGILVSYEQVMPTVTSEGKKIWLISKRIHESQLNRGNTWNYIREKDYIQEFQLNEIAAGNVIKSSEFGRNFCTQLEGYYHGNTADGLYNDSTGNAYLIKYLEDGTVRTFYKGKFKNGQFDDNTGDAWYITRSKDTSYMYYKGQFINGKPQKGDDSVFKNDLTMEEIEDILRQNRVSDEYNWAIKSI